MRQHPLLNACMTLITLAAVCLVGYLAIDAFDQNRRQSVRTEQAFNRLSDALDKLGDSVSGLPAAVTAASQYGGGAPREGAREGLATLPKAASPSSLGNNRAGGGYFANDDLRDPQEEDGGTVTSRIQSLPGNLNNLVTNEATVGVIWGYLMDSLAERNLDDQTRFEPQMAESWEVSPDGLVYTIHLRKNVMWQSYTDPVSKKEVPAKPVTSRDFLFFWNTMQNPNVPCEYMRTYYEDIEGLEMLDDHNFKVKWKQPYSMAEEFTLGLSPLPEHYYRPDPSWTDERFAEEFISSPRNQWIVGVGPYRLAKWDKNEEIVFERDENYYGRPATFAKRRIRLIQDNSTSFLEFKKGGLDTYGLLPSQWQDETPEPDFHLITPDIENANADSKEWDLRKKAGDVPENYRFEKFQFYSQSWYYVGYNLRRPLFKEREIRTALTHLIDRQRILDEVYLGLGEVISGPFIPKSPYYNHAVEPIPFDIEKAQQILAANGWEDTDQDGILDKDLDGNGKRVPFRFTYIIPSSASTARKTAAIIEQDMIKAKIKVDIKPIEWSVYIQLLDNRDYDVCSLAWSGGVEGDPYQIWHGSGATRSGSSNHVSYDSPEANRLIEEGRREVDKPRRYEIYHKLHEVIARDQPYTFLISPTNTLAQSKRFRNAIVYKGGQMNSSLQWIPKKLQ